jgi:hypothetical protein
MIHSLSHGELMAWGEYASTIRMALNIFPVRCLKCARRRASILNDWLFPDMLIVITAFPSAWTANDPATEM